LNEDPKIVVSVLIENFTWDWIYQSYLEKWPGFNSHISYLNQLYSTADYHLQAEPVCNPVNCDIVTHPIARHKRQEPSVVRDRLRVAETDTLVLVTMGGVPGTELPFDRMLVMEQSFILPGQAVEEILVKENLRLLPPDSGIYHPDLVVACDAVVGKVGYSTLAEIYQAGIPFGYICRPDFRESAPLKTFINREMVSMEITWEQFKTNKWLDRVPELCRLVPDRRDKKNGAMTAAAFLAELLEHNGIRKSYCIKS